MRQEDGFGSYLASSVIQPKKILLSPNSHTHCESKNVVVTLLKHVRIQILLVCHEE